MSLKKSIRRALGLALLLTQASVVPAALSASPSVQSISPSEQKELLKDTAGLSAGATNADVTIVEYFDYNCPGCRILAPNLTSLIADDHRVAVVYKEWPVFGGVSVYAAKEALAATWQGKYVVAHEALISGPRITSPEQVDAELRSAGIDGRQLAKDLAAHAEQINALLARNDTEARATGVRGTPGIVIERTVLPGSVDLAGLRQLVAAARGGHAQ